MWSTHWQKKRLILTILHRFCVAASSLLGHSFCHFQPWKQIGLQKAFQNEIRISTLPNSIRYLNCCKSPFLFFPSSLHLKEKRKKYIRINLCILFPFPSLNVIILLFYTSCSRSSTRIRVAIVMKLYLFLSSFNLAAAATTLARKNFFLPFPLLLLVCM